MFDFIPEQTYSITYLYISGVIVLFTVLNSLIVPLESEKNLSFFKFMGIILLVFVLAYLGFRPISWVFGDMRIYENRYIYYANGGEVAANKDVGFALFMKVLSFAFSVKTFFFICAFFYIYPLYRSSKKWFNNYWYYAFLMAVISFSFWPYGSNGIRNGLATSVFVLALANENKKVYAYSLFVISFLCHASLLLPIACFFVANMYKDTKLYFRIWLLAIPLSLVSGGFWEGFIGGLGFDDRLSYLTDYTYQDSFAYTGFRWDFLIYSGLGVLSGWYFIFKKGYESRTYSLLLITYLLSNSFWILVIRASFSNRFAYLSWFLLPFVIIYPLVDKKIFKNQNSITGVIIFTYFIITFILTSLF